MAKRAKRKAAATTAPKRKVAGARGASKSTKKSANYPIAQTLRWVADGERLLIKWGAIKSPGAKRIANTVAQILSVLEALTELRKV